MPSQGQCRTHRPDLLNNWSGNATALVDLGVVGRVCMRAGFMSVIMLLTWQRVDKRWWSSSVVFSALTEQRRNMMDSASGQDGRMDLGLRDREGYSGTPHVI